MNQAFYPVIVRALDEEEGGGYVAFVLDLPGCMGDGATPEEAMADAREAVEEWIDEAKRLGRDVPEPESFIVRQARDGSESAQEAIAKQGELIAAHEQLIAAQERLIASLRAQIHALTHASGDLDPTDWHGIVRSASIAARQAEKDGRPH